MVPESSAALLTAQEAHSESLVHNTQQRGEATWWLLASLSFQKLPHSSEVILKLATMTTCKQISNQQTAAAQASLLVSDGLRFQVPR